MRPEAKATEAAELSDDQLAQARCLAYGLLADLVARGVDPSTRDAAQTSAPLADAIASYASARPERLSDADLLDLLAVDHQHAFGWSVPPFEGAFLDPARSIGGEATDALWAIFTAAGFVPDVSREDVEHLATSLRCLAFLSGAEADAIEDGHTGAILRVRELSRRLLDEHLLCWVPTFVNAVERTGLAFPRALAAQIESLLVTHRAALGAPARRHELLAPAIDLDDPETGLREIGEHLATPARCGVFLSRDDVTRIGRGLKVPRGFGDRTQLLVNLLRSAASYDALDALLSALEEEMAREDDALASEHGIMAELVRPWRERTRETAALLRRVRADAARFVAEPTEDQQTHMTPDLGPRYSETPCSETPETPCSSPAHDLSAGER
jgi:TorA maturation chaperone TorD